MSTLTAELLELQERLKEQPNAKTAREIIDDYLGFFSQESIHRQLWVLTIGTVTNDELEQSEKGRDRFNHIFFYEYTRLFFDAVRTLYPSTTK